MGLNQLRRHTCIIIIVVLLNLLTHHTIKMFAHTSASKERRQFLAAGRIEDEDFKRGVAAECEDQEVILLQFMSLDKRSGGHSPAVHEP